MTIPPSLAQPQFSQAPIETTDPNAISKTVVDAKGDLIAGTADNAVTRQPVGSNGEFLVADSAQATGLDWVANPVNTAFDAKGDILVGTGSDTYVKLAVGTDNQVLVADSTQASGVRWSSEQDPNAIVKSIVDAKGDLIAATAADTPARLPVGTNNQLLIADSAQTTGLKWGRPTIALGTETSGNYTAAVIAGTGVTVSGGTGPTNTATVAIGQDVSDTASVVFGGLTVDSGVLYVDATNNRVGVNNVIPAYALDVTGDGHFTTNLTVDGTLYANHIHGELAGPVYIHVKNTSGSTITSGTPVYITGTVGATQVAEIAPADASNSAKMPAIGLTDGDMIHNATGHVVVLGALDGQDTITGSWQLNDHVYVASGGGRTRTRPTGTSDIIQCVGHVSRLNSNTGEIVVNAGSTVSAPNTISIPGNITTTAGQFTGSGAGLTSIPASQLSGSVPSGNIGNDSIALGTKTTGDYVATLQAGTGVTITNGSGEGVSPTIAIGQQVGTTDSPQFAALTTTGTASLNAASVTGSISANSLSSTTSTTTATLIVDGIEIDTTGATSNQVLSYNGTKFAPTSLTTSGVPVGTITQYAMNTAPAGWLLCDGSAVSRTTYADLWSLIGPTYGSGNGSTTFNVPNLKGRIPVGLDATQTEFDTLGETGGAKTHTLTSTEMPSHTHTQNSHTHTQDAHNHSQNSHNHSQNSHNHGGSVGTGEFLYRDATYSTGYNSWVGGVYLAITWNGGTAYTTASNIATTASNIATTATNQSTTATNQNTGGGGAHNNLQPYIVLTYIIKT